MNRILTLVILVFLTVSCSMQAKLNRDFKGEQLNVVEKTFTDLPSSKIPLRNGNSKIIFTKESFLGATTINQGEATMDPIKSPPVKKTEQFIFIVDQNGMVLSTEYETNYQQQY